MKRSILDRYLMAHPHALEDLAHRNLIRPFIAPENQLVSAFERALREERLHYSETTLAVMRRHQQYQQVCYSLKMRLTSGQWRLLDAGRLSRKGSQRLALRQQFAAENLDAIVEFFESMQRAGRGPQRSAGFSAADLTAAWYGHLRAAA